MAVPSRKPLRVYINGRFLSQMVTGVQRYALEIVRCLDRLAGDPGFAHVRFTLLVPPGAGGVLPLENIRVRKAGLLNGQLWEQLALPFLSFGGMLLNFGNTAPFLKARQYLTVHDANMFLVPASFSWRMRAWYALNISVVAKYAKGVWAPSQYARRTIARHYGVRESKIEVFNCGHEHILRVQPEPGALRKFGLAPGSYVLAVSSLSPNKNFEGVVKAFAAAGMAGVRLAIAGGSLPNFFSKVALDGGGYVHLGYVSDAELKELYRHALFFAFPSFAEGFGIPPLEAATCGCPVLLSDRTSLPEVFGDAALYCDPASVEDIADKMRKLREDPALRERLREKGRERAERYKWKDSARGILAAVVRDARNAGG